MMIEIKTITIEKYMKYSQLYNLLSENGFIKTMNLTYTHKSERKKPHPFFATQCTNLHFCGFTDLTIYFVASSYIVMSQKFFPISSVS